MPPSPADSTFRFGTFELDVPAYALRRRGKPVRLERRPMDLLILLLERRGQLVSRADIVDRLWGADVFVDVETGVNTAIRKIRRALADSSDAPTFLETVPGKGYRFVGEARAVEAEPEESASRVTLAVLPFENLGADPEREYLADGLTEEAIAALGQIDPDHLSVIGRTSVMTYKRTTKTLAEIGRELNAAYLVEGTIRTEGARLRITPKLIRVRDQIQIWSGSYESEPPSVLEFQRELSAAIAEQIRMRLSPESLPALERRRTRDAEAYDLYLRGRYFWNQHTPPTTRRALECYTRATALDPSYALAWSGLADAHTASPITGDARPRDVWPRARDAVAHAVGAEPKLAQTQASRGFLDFWLNWDWKAAEQAFRAATALDPGYAFAHRMRGIVRAHSGQHESARVSAKRARELDPLHAMEHALSAQVAFQARDYSEAMQFARQATVIDPDFWIGHFQLAQAYEQLGKADEALGVLQTAARLSGGNSKPIGLRGYILAKRGQTGGAEDVLRTLEAIANERYVPPYAMALVHAGLGRPDLAFEWLERAYDALDVHLVFLAHDPKWDALRADPRCGAILGRCGFGYRR